MAGAVVALGLLAWHLYVDHFWSWDLFAVALTVVGVKMAVMAWSILND